MDAPPAGPLPAWRALVEAGRLAPDSSQRLAATRLQELWGKLRGYDPPAARRFLLSRLLRFRPAEEAGESRPNGLYLVGDVGRGKSMLMDLFFAQAEVTRKRRIHFLEFMVEVHARLQTWRGENEGDDPIPPLADAIAAESALLCFDEFQVNDIADAILLGRLFQALFERGVVVVATSNTPPDRLFRGPGQDAFRPFIEMLKQRLDVLVLEGGRDYRRGRLLRELGLWHVPADAAAAAAVDTAFAELSGGGRAAPCRLRVLGRWLEVPLAASGVARFDFAALCQAALGPADYLALATHFQALALDRVPRLGPEDANAARRFTVLIDALYEHRVKLVASAAASPDALYTGDDGGFARTASRLAEMQGEAYLALPHLT